MAGSRFRSCVIPGARSTPARSTTGLTGLGLDAPLSLLARAAMFPNPLPLGGTSRTARRRRHPVGAGNSVRVVDQVIRAVGPGATMILGQSSRERSEGACHGNTRFGTQLTMDAQHAGGALYLGRP